METEYTTQRVNFEEILISILGKEGAEIDEYKLEGVPMNVAFRQIGKKERGRLGKTNTFSFPQRNTHMFLHSLHGKTREHT